MQLLKLNSIKINQEIIKYLIISFLMLLPIVNLQAQTHQTYKRFFGKSYQKALDYMTEHRTTFRTYLQKNNADAAVLMAIAFPELLRFNQLQNKLETSFLEVLYVKHGTAYANFSVGRFQMKPSFVETLEGYARTYLGKKYQVIYTYPTKEPQKVRKMRVERINMLVWQLRYLNCFYAIMEKRFAQRNWENTNAKLRFFATAYNYNFLASARAIERWALVRAFPYGRKYFKKQYSYAEIADDFYQHEVSKILK